MPIYAYKCESCGHAKDVLQKISDAQLTVCPACGAASFRKQVTAAGFQLKGSGWYVTDFRGGAEAGKKDSGTAVAPATEAKADGAKSETKTETKSTDSTPAPAASSSSSSEGSGGG